MARYEVHEFTADALDDAARLLAERHRRHRQAVPALDPVYEDPTAARAEIEALLGRERASGVVVTARGAPSAYVLGTTRPDTRWGPNVWIEDAGSAGNDPEAIREAYAAAAVPWVAAGWTNHYINVPAIDAELVEAWFGLSFGKQHIHALRDAVPADFMPSAAPGLVIRRVERADIPALAELGLVVPRHVAESPVFSYMAQPTLEESLAEAEADFGDPKYTEFAAEHDGRVIGTAVACSLELSPGNTKLMRPRSCGFLGHAAVLPSARGLGAGRALGQAVMAWARDEGYEWVAADWRSTNLSANRTWSGLGFRPSFFRLQRAIV
jgi:GNAT superfamily N-acetyltransferase/fructose-specific component phosphotransferase system IIB-like protein